MKRRGVSIAALAFMGLILAACDLLEGGINTIDISGQITIEKEWVGNAVPEAPSARFQISYRGTFQKEVTLTGNPASQEVTVLSNTVEYIVTEVTESLPANCSAASTAQRVSDGGTVFFRNECDVFPTAEPTPSPTAPPVGLSDFNNWFGYDDGTGNRIWVDEQGNLNCQAVFSDPYVLAWTTPLDLPRFDNFGFGWKVDKVSGAVFTWFVFLFGGEYEDSELVAFYELRILSDGGVYLLWRDNITGESVDIFSGSSVFTNLGSTPNWVDTVMQGQNFTLGINTSKVLETTLPDYSGGGIGLGCAAGEDGTVHYKFYDFGDAGYYILND